MSSRKKEKDQAAQAALQAAQEEMDLILGTRLNFQEFDDLMYNSSIAQESENQVGQIVDSVFEAAWTHISSKNINQLLVPYSSNWAINELNDVLHCYFLNHDAGETSTDGWRPNMEPSGSQMDSWSRGVLEVKKPKQVKIEEPVVTKKPRSRRGGARSTRSTVRSNRGGLRANSRGSRMGTATPTYRVTPSAARNATEDDDDQIKLRKELEEEKKAAERRRKQLAAEEKRDEERAVALQRELKNKQFTFDSKGNIVVVHANDTHRMKTMDKINVKINVQDTSPSTANNGRDSKSRRSRKTRRQGTGIMKTGGSSANQSASNDTMGVNMESSLASTASGTSKPAGLHVTSKGLQALRATQQIEASKPGAKKKKSRKKKTDYFEPQTEVMPSAGTSIRVSQGVTFREGGIIRTGPKRAHTQSNWSKEEYQMLRKAEEEQSKQNNQEDGGDEAELDNEDYLNSSTTIQDPQQELLQAQQRARQQREKREQEKSKKKSMYRGRNTPTPPPVKPEGPQPIIRQNLKVTMANSKKRVSKFKTGNNGTIRPVDSEKLSLLIDNE